METDNINNKRVIMIGGVEKFSVVDYPGKLAAVVFMQGCPWRCPFCYNTYLQEAKGETNVVWGKFLEFLEIRKELLNAIVFSGGEPLMQPALETAVKEVVAIKGYAIGLHTGGYRSDILERILPHISWIGFDIKAPFDVDKYKKAIGRDIDFLPEVQKSLSLIINSGIDFECRTTCDPKILTIEDIYEIARTLKDMGVKKYFLQMYRPIEGDHTPISECEKFFQDQELEAFLRASFSEFDFRK